MTRRENGWADSVPLGIARAWLRARLLEGARCPLCTQHAMLYDRSIYGAMGRGLARAWAENGHEPWRMKHYVPGTGDGPKLRYWGLIIEEAIVRPDGGRAGYWHVTERGEAFVLGEIRLPKYARVYDNELQKLHGDPVTIRDCLPKTFDLDELLRGAA